MAVIESLIRRKGGSVITFGDTSYHFTPESDGGPHLATVDNPEHAKTLLSIKEGYRMAGAPANPVVIPVIPNIPTGDPSPSAPNDASGGSEGGEGGAQVLEPNAGPQEGQGEPTSESDENGEDAPLDREALAQEFKEKFGRLPHGKWSAERIAEELATTTEYD